MNNLRDKVQQALQQLNQVLIGKESVTELAIASVLAGGHLLLEDLPGMGKTTLAQGMARVLGLEQQRVQFTVDLLPADIVGVSVFDSQQQSFNFHPGPIFSQLLLADEINRASPKTQSALLEAMAEEQVSVDGKTYPLPKPFFVIATQNPVSQFGTFPLPESQLDRFMLRLSLGYPALETEKRLLRRNGRLADDDQNLQAQITLEQLLAAQTEADSITVSDSVLDYLLRLVQGTREKPEFRLGVSPRGALALLRVSKALAWLRGREFLLPEDIQDVAPAALSHRVEAVAGGDVSVCERLIRQLIETTDVLE